MIPPIAGGSHFDSQLQDNSQFHLWDLHEAEAFLKELRLSPLPDDALIQPPPTPHSMTTPNKIWTPAKSKKKSFQTPQHSETLEPPD